MVNASESVINLVSWTMPKMLIGMNQNGVWADFGFAISGARTFSPPGKSRHLTFQCHLRKTRKTRIPARGLLRAGRPQGTLLGVRAWEVGESEGRAVIAWIGVEGPPNITPPEREQTSDWSLVAREFGEPL